MTPVFELVDLSEVEVLRSELLAEAGMSEEEMRCAAASRGLDQDRQAILRRLDELKFLSD